MKLNRKVLATIIIVVVLILSSVYVFSLTDEKNIDNKPPTIDTITGDITGNKGNTITIFFNGNWVKDVTDTGYITGKVGICAWDAFNYTNEYWFDKIGLYYPWKSHKQRYTKLLFNPLVL